MSTKKKLTRPHTLADAADLLDVGARQAQRLAADGLLGPLRLPTLAERLQFGFPSNCQIVRNLSHAQRLKKARAKAMVDRRLAANRKGRRVRR